MKVLLASLKHFVVQKLQVSNQQAITYILAGRVRVNGSNGQLQQALQPEDEVTFEGQVIKEPKAFVYLAYNKPRGIESTLNTHVENNLTHALNLNQRVFPIGRLDKESEGLMLLTNDGTVLYKTIHAKIHQEKEYLVSVDRPLTPEALQHLATGIMIMGKQTRPAVVAQINTHAFRIILNQGLNRQIRRMCYKLGYQVQQLIRTRIVNLELGGLEPGEWRYLSQPEVQELLQAVAT
ncbi:pseudouridine synthase [Adhaeribacter pallidiroseus]|uniref:Pseudouridine synthase n=1 Tax=Adhaeribacter pallidiroseus TaxID=2072847 RepID=A0A369QC79_9BACT|nr:pseudouridine synthase [Adhaeribacter pallidiroseus]RDC62501.1 23S rRNA pseudouridine(2604) synthase [Adhaeribacter pallidiroseus]